MPDTEQPSGKYWRFYDIGETCALKQNQDGDLALCYRDIDSPTMPDGTLDTLYRKE